MTKSHSIGISLAAAAALLAAGCGGEDSAGTGNVAFTTWGEGYIEQEIPAADVADGWRVTFSKFLVVLRDVTVADREGNVGAQMDGSLLVDHTMPSPKPVVRFEGLEAKPWERVSFRIGPADANTVLEGATEEDRQLLLSSGASLYAEGQIESAGATKSFRWAFQEDTVYRECRGEKDGKETEGVSVTNGGTDTVELTIHGDHLFYDDLQAEAAVLRAQAIADADADMDGEVTLTELSAVPLVSIPEGSYGTGSAGNIDDLGAFVVALSRTVGHFRGEGECISGAP
ncbi:MAG TPA: hypothetical protein VLS89_07825 [Candidatus Nanopelagicales bacterium]|nr:hypothetical protein [Candidatus Nanopelagicales bacterium]